MSDPNPCSTVHSSWGGIGEGLEMAILTGETLGIFRHDRLFLRKDVRIGQLRLRHWRLGMELSEDVEVRHLARTRECHMMRIRSW